MVELRAVCVMQFASDVTEPAEIKFGFCISNPSDLDSDTDLSHDHS